MTSLEQTKVVLECKMTKYFRQYNRTVMYGDIDDPETDGYLNQLIALYEQCSNMYKKNGFDLDGFEKKLTHDHRGPKA